MSLFEELKRRNVIKVAVAYLISAWLLIQIADTVFPYIGLNASLITLIIAMATIGFPLVLVLAWVYEFTPEGLRKESEIEAGSPLRRGTAKRLNLGITVLLTVAVVYLVADKFFISQDLPAADPEQPVSLQTTDTAPAIDRSIAVLPFRVMSDGENDGYFADGLTEEILNSLARLPELLVTARTSSFFFKDKDIPVPEIAKTLGVAHVVEGSVRRAGDTVRITAQLIRASDGFHLWSDTYDRTLEDVFAVQEDIAVNIATTLTVVLDEDKRQQLFNTGIRDIDAFITYQKAYGEFDRALASDRCVTNNWIVSLAFLKQGPFYDIYSRLVSCDPLNYLNWIKLFMISFWSADAGLLRSDLDRSIEVTGSDTTWTEFYLLQSYLLEGDFAGARTVPTSHQGKALINVPYEVSILAAEGRVEEANALFREKSTPVTNRLDTRMLQAAITGNREEANRLAAMIDPRRLSVLSFLFATLSCGCGEIFDLEAAPGFKRKIEESGLAWPPATMIRYPAKDW